MKNYFGTFCISLFLLLPLSSPAQINELIKDTKEKLSGNQTGGAELSSDKIAAGLKEALTVGSKNAVEIVSQVDGYFGNDLIKISLPGELKSIENIARQFGLGAQFDEILLSMNRAAEIAAKSATPIFMDAITGMSISDAMKILNGKENEATLYFKDKTELKLTETFKPVVTEAMNQFGVTKSYRDLASNIQKLPFVSLKVTDIDDYVTSKALDGLFTMIAIEEKTIRENPSARISDLLKDVFGGLGKP